MPVTDRARAVWARLPVLTPERYRVVTLVALWLLVFIVVTGAAVRLTGSGLGCTDWPRCQSGRFVAPMQFNPMVEFVNRVITGLVSVAVVLAVLGSLRRTPRRRDLTLLSLGLVAGVIAQIVLGGLVVLFDLNPVLVQLHFVVSMALVADALVLHHRAARPDGPRRSLVSPTVRRGAIALVIMAGLVITTGTAVTGSGPNAGDERAKRLPFTVRASAQVHGTLLIAFLAAVLWVVWMLRRDGAPMRTLRSAQTLLTVLVLQAAVGYTQYFTEIPPLLVGLHVFGATLVWLAVLAFLMGLSEPSSGPRDSDHDDDGAGRDLVAHG